MSAKPYETNEQTCYGTIHNGLRSMFLLPGPSHCFNHLSRPPTHATAVHSIFAVVVHTVQCVLHNSVTEIHQRCTGLPVPGPRLDAQDASMFLHSHLLHLPSNAC